MNCHIIKDAYVDEDIDNDVDAKSVGWQCELAQISWADICTIIYLGLGHAMLGLNSVWVAYW
jgi:hypothetical protein